jgi:hypothetical protein
LPITSARRDSPNVMILDSTLVLIRRTNDGTKAHGLGAIQALRTRRTVFTPIIWPRPAMNLTLLSSRAAPRLAPELEAGVKISGVLAKGRLDPSERAKNWCCCLRDRP